MQKTNSSGSSRDARTHSTTAELFAEIGNQDTRFFTWREADRPFHSRWMQKAEQKKAPRVVGDQHVKTLLDGDSLSPRD